MRLPPATFHTKHLDTFFVELLLLLLDGHCCCCLPLAAGASSWGGDAVRRGSPCLPLGPAPTRWTSRRWRYCRCHPVGLLSHF